MEKQRYEENSSPVTIPARVLKKNNDGNGVTAEDIQLLEETRPRTRADCQNGERPCPFVGCRHHLYLDVNSSTKSIRLNFPNKEVWEIPQTCALDMAEKGGITLEEIGEILNLTRERIRQIETEGFIKVLQRLPPEDDDKATQELLADYLRRKKERYRQIKTYDKKYKRRRKRDNVSSYRITKNRLKNAASIISARCQDTLKSPDNPSTLPRRSKLQARSAIRC